MSTVLPSAESGGQSVRRVGLQLDHVCAAEGTYKTVESRAARTLVVERILVKVTVDSDSGVRYIGGRMQSNEWS